jgi:hypothetical protein
MEDRIAEAKGKTAKGLFLNSRSVAAHVGHNVLVSVASAAKRIVMVASHFHGESRKLSFRLPFRFWTSPPFSEDGAKRVFLLHD